MAAFGFTSTGLDMLAGGFSTWKVKATGDGGFYSLGEIAEGKFTPKTLQIVDSKGQSRVYGVDVAITAQLLCSDKVGVLEQIPYLLETILTHKILFTNGVTATGDWGLGLKFDSTKDYDGIRFIEITAGKRILLTSDWTALLATPAADGSPASSDILHALSATTFCAAGATAFETRNIGETSWETMGEFRNTKLTIQSKTTLDGHGRPRCYGLQITASCDMLQAAAAEMGLLDDLAGGRPDCRVTLADGTIFTFNNNVGVKWEIHNDKGIEDLAYTTVTYDGFVTLPTFAGLIS